MHALNRRENGTAIPGLHGRMGGVRRVSVVGNSGSGKSSLARRVAEAIGAPHVELDAIHHLRGWRPIDPDVFKGTIEEITSGENWVIDGNYRSVVVDGPVWARADTVVWLDLPRSTVMRQVIVRTLRRTARREVLWNGNREPLKNFWVWHPDSIIRWSWTQHARYEECYGQAMTSATFSHLEFVRLRSHALADEWIDGLGPAGN